MQSKGLKLRVQCDKSDALNDAANTKKDTFCGGKKDDAL